MNQKKSKRILTELESKFWIQSMKNVRRFSKSSELRSDISFNVENIKKIRTFKDNNNQYKTLNLKNHRMGLNQSSKLALKTGGIGDSDRKTVLKLRKGKFNIDRRIDLHGFNLKEARENLLDFLIAAQSSGCRCVLIVTGRGMGQKGGMGKIKMSVPKWFNSDDFRPLILAFSKAIPKHGGEGALYVLMRKIHVNSEFI